MKNTSAFKDIIEYRRSVRAFDPDIKIDSDIVKSCIAQATLAPNSSNMQLWEFHQITSPELLQKMTAACLGQGAASTAKEMVVVVVRKDLWKKRTKTHLKYLKNLFGNKDKSTLSSREKFAFNYYGKLMPFVYSDFLGVFGLAKYVFAWISGLFKPTYRQLRKSDMRIVAHKSAGLAAQTFMLAMAANKYDTCPMEGTDTTLIKKILKLPFSAEINMVISCGIRMPKGIYGERFRIPFDDVYTKW